MYNIKRCEPYTAGFTSPATVNNTVHQKPHQQQLNYQIPASALYEAPETDPTGRSGYGRVTTLSSCYYICQLLITLR